MLGAGGSTSILSGAGEAGRDECSGLSGLASLIVVCEESSESGGGGGVASAGVGSSVGFDDAAVVPLPAGGERGFGI